MAPVVAAGLSQSGVYPGRRTLWQACAPACVPAAKKETSCKRRQAPLLYRAILGVQARPLGRGQPFLERPLDLGQALQERLLDLIQSLL